MKPVRTTLKSKQLKHYAPLLSRTFCRSLHLDKKLCKPKNAFFFFYKLQQMKNPVVLVLPVLKFEAKIFLFFSFQKVVLTFGSELKLRVTQWKLKNQGLIKAAVNICIKFKLSAVKLIPLLNTVQSLRSNPQGNMGIRMGIKQKFINSQCDWTP